MRSISMIFVWLMPFLALTVSAFSLTPSPFTKLSTAPVTERTKSTLQMTVLTYQGKKKNFKPGTPLSKAVQQLGLKPTYSCKKGDCATCEIFLAGRLTKPCVAKVPEEPRLKSLQEKGLEIRA